MNNTVGASKVRIHYVLDDPSSMLMDEVYRQLNAQIATGFSDIELRVVSPKEAVADPGDLCLFQADVTGLDAWLERLPKKEGVLALIIRERDPIPSQWGSARVDDLWVYPFRTAEIAQKLRMLFWLKEHRKIRESAAALEQTVQRLTEDLQFAAVLKDQHRPKKFSDFKGITVSSRYFAGTQSGGDYFDVLETTDSQNLLLWMTDATSYGLSSAVVSTLSAMGAQLVAAQALQGLGWVRSFCLKLGPQLARKGTLSGFWGVLSRKDLTLKYLSFGGMGGFRVKADGKVEILESHPTQLTAAQAWSPEWQEKQIRLSPGERLILISDGFLSAVGGRESMAKLIESNPQPLRGASDVEGTGISETRRFEDGLVDSLEVLVKGKLPSADDLAPQDCSWVCLSFDSKMLRLA